MLAASVAPERFMMCILPRAGTLSGGSASREMAGSRITLEHQTSFCVVDPRCLEYKRGYRLTVSAYSRSSSPEDLWMRTK